MDRDIIRQQYDFEMEQRNVIASTTNIPIVAITVLSSALSVVIIDFQYRESIQTYIFLSLAIATVISIVFGISFIFKSFWNYEYQKIPKSGALKNHYKELLAWHENNGFHADKAKSNADTDFQDYISEKLSEASDWNSQNNIIRGNYIHRATASIAFAIVFLIPSGALYAYNKAQSPEKVYQVNLTQNPPSNLNCQAQVIKMATTPSNPSVTPAPSPSSPTITPIPVAPTTNTKPVGPSNEMFKSTTDLIKPNAEGSILKK